MNITEARVFGNDNLVVIDGRAFSAGEKYTILETGYALYLLGEPRDADSARWMLTHGETIPPDKSDNRAALKSNRTTLVTSHPILFALAYKFWWHRNGEPLPENQPLLIPAFDEALEIQRNRLILNRFNRKYKGKLPTP